MCVTPSTPSSIWRNNNDWEGFASRSRPEVGKELAGQIANRNPPAPLQWRQQIILRVPADRFITILRAGINNLVQLFMPPVSPLIAALLLTASPLIQADSGCSDKWRSIEVYQLAREAETSIAYQCSESRCPPRSVLKQRAIIAARTLALAEIRAAVSSLVSQEVTVGNGQIRQQTTLYAGGQVHDIVTCEKVEGDTVRVRAFGVVRDREG